MVLRSTWTFRQSSKRKWQAHSPLLRISKRSRRCKLCFCSDGGLCRVWLQEKAAAQLQTVEGQAGIRHEMFGAASARCLSPGGPMSGRQGDEGLEESKSLRPNALKLEFKWLYQDQTQADSSVWSLMSLLTVCRMWCFSGLCRYV